MRPRFDKEDLILVLEALANLFQFYARKKDRIKVRQIYLLFQALTRQGTGRRQEWYWYDDEFISKRRVHYRDMLKAISTLTESDHKESRN
jgi:hypothetical protein